MWQQLLQLLLLRTENCFSKSPISDRFSPVMTRVRRDLGTSNTCQQVGWGPPSPPKISVDPRSSAAKVFAVAFAENCFSKAPAPNRSSPVTTGVKGDVVASTTCH